MGFESITTKASDAVRRLPKIPLRLGKNNKLNNVHFRKSTQEAGQAKDKTRGTFGRAVDRFKKAPMVIKNVTFGKNTNNKANDLTPEKIAKETYASVRDELQLAGVLDNNELMRGNSGASQIAKAMEKYFSTVGNAAQGLEGMKSPYKADHKENSEEQRIEAASQFAEKFTAFINETFGKNKEEAKQKAGSYDPVLRAMMAACIKAIKDSGVDESKAKDAVYSAIALWAMLPAVNKGVTDYAGLIPSRVMMAVINNSDVLYMAFTDEALKRLKEHDCRSQIFTFFDALADTADTNVVDAAAQAYRGSAGSN